MSRLEIMSPTRARIVMEGLYKDLERRIESSPPGLCPVDMARAFLELCHAQTCGKCVPCRIGLGQLNQLIRDVLNGKATMDTLDLMEKTALSIMDSADCAIGYEAANMVYKGLIGYRDDYVEHIRNGRCTCTYNQPVPCVAICPAHVDIPGYVALVEEGRYADAIRLIRKDNPFPTTCGFICEHPCEARCRRNMVDDAVNIRGLKRFAADYAGFVDPPECAPSTGKKVAVLGGGPGGLSAAYYLQLMGHQTTVYEMLPKLGGMLRYGIPNMKLEKSVIDRRVRLMEEEGVIFKTNVNVGVDVKAAKLLKDFDRVVLCCGASNPRDIKVPGREAEGIYFAVDFLKGVTKSLLDSDLADQKFVACKNKKVMVIGGGDTGNDCVGTAIRLGASSVVQLEMMPKAPDQRAVNNPWPEWPRVCKTDYGQQEAIAVFGHDPRIYQTTVKEFIADDKGRLKKAVLVKLQSKKDEKTGRMMMVPVEGSEWTVEVDVVLIAAGFLGSQKYVTDAFKVDLTPRTNVATEAEKYQTSVKNVFTAGDMHRGQSLVVWAIHEGREAAKAVDESLMGYTNLV